MRGDVLVVAECCRHGGSAIVALCLAWVSAAAGAWPEQTGRQLTIETTEYFESEQQDSGFQQFISRTYVIRGISEHLSFGTVVAYANQFSYGPTFSSSQSGLSEAELFAQAYRKQRGNHATAFNLTGAFSTSQDIADSRAMGNDAALQFSTLRGWGNEQFFLEALLGYRRSLGSDRDQLRANLTLGLKEGDAMILLQSYTTESVMDGSERGADFDLTQIGLSAVLPVREGLKIAFGGRRDLSVRGLEPGQALFLSLWWRR
ncbi:MAG: hypothetical protein AAF511_01325 [Pseudomonadota bacterium]